MRYLCICPSYTKIRKHCNKYHSSLSCQLSKVHEGSANSVHIGGHRSYLKAINDGELRAGVAGITEQDEDALKHVQRVNVRDLYFSPALGKGEVDSERALDVKVLAVVVFLTVKDETSHVSLVGRNGGTVPGDILSRTSGPDGARSGVRDSRADHVKLERVQGCSADMRSNGNQEGEEEGSKRRKHREVKCKFGCERIE